MPILASLATIHDRLYWLGLLLFSFGLRVWRLDRLGLSYDEAATALMAQADPLAIVSFHRDAAFENPPYWTLLMHGWSLLAGQSEFSLRFIAACAGVLAIPLMGQLVHLIWPGRTSPARLVALLTALSPVLVYYSQEARTYTLVVMLAIVTTLLSLRLSVAFTWPPALALLFTIWAMLGLHYFSALLLLGLGLYFGILWLTNYKQDAAEILPLLGVYVLSVLPMLGWIALSPGFRETWTVVTDAAELSPVGPVAFLHDTWRELAFGAIRWIPPQADLSLLLAPLVLAGAWVAIWTPPQPGPAPLRHAGWLFAILGVLPLIIGVVFLRTISTRYILYVAPFLWLCLALSIARAWRTHRWFGITTLALTLLVFGTGLTHYTTRYIKSDYQTMAVALRQRFIPGQEAILFEGPRQHLLAKYYLPDDWPLYPMPTIVLPDFWPIAAPPIVPDAEDDRIRAYLRDYDALWTIYTGENEVDRGEFLAKYLHAVAYQRDCETWLDVRLCHYLSPQSISPQTQTPVSLLYGQDLILNTVQTALYEPVSGPTALLVQLDWHAVRKPALNYRVSLRLLAPDGAVMAQIDDYPIGLLLLPTTWEAGERKSGYMSMHLPDALPPGNYPIAVVVYDAATILPVAGRSPGIASPADTPAPADIPAVVALLQVSDTMQLLSEPPAAASASNQSQP